ncbi:MAG: penicillin-binding protein activator LpoB [Bacteroidales bacterium]|nr:penicillin-binding protein activator LpoB [Bacteroidales bacterium]
MKKLTFYLLTCLLLSGFIGKAQTDNEITIGVLPFTFSVTSANQGEAQSISEAVINAFVKTKRFNVLDRGSMQKIFDELEIQKNPEFIDSEKLAEQGKMKGADFLLAGYVSQIKTEYKKPTVYNTPQGKITKPGGYYCNISFNIKIIDVATSAILAIDKIETKGGNMMVTDASKAFQGAMEGIAPDIDKFVDNNFPLTFTIAAIEEVKKGKATVVLIDGGEDFGIEKGCELKVVEVQEIGGKLRKREIGSVKVDNVEGEFSTCKVGKGGDLIKSKFDAGTKLEVITCTKKK